MQKIADFYLHAIRNFESEFEVMFEYKEILDCLNCLDRRLRLLTDLVEKEVNHAGNSLSET